MTPFGTADSQVKQVFCDMSAIKGQFNETESRYTSSGVCVELDSPQSNAKGTSEFPDINRSTEVFRAAWTAQGSYNPLTKETWEKLTMPAPNIDQKTPVGRPYGNYETRMICATDPWLSTMPANCTDKKVLATGNLGDMEAALRKALRPVTTPNKMPQRQALIDARDRYVAQHAINSTTASNSKLHAGAYLFVPTVAEPKEGSTHPPQTPLRVRVAAAKDAKDTSYVLEIEVQANFSWRALTRVSVSAAVAQSALGYRGWGLQTAGAAPEMMAVVGVYRMRVQTTAPSRSAPSDWVEFKIDGKPGVSIQDAAATKVDKVGSAATALKAGTATTAAARATAPPATKPAALGSAAETLKSKADAVSLNPQPLPPKLGNTPLLNANASPLTATKNKADAVSLNPQPLPPANKVVPTQVPSALQ